MTDTVTTRDDLTGALESIARVPQLLVACDYDGTVAPIVNDPMTALPRRETVVALRTLANLPQTHVAVVSGRSLRDLAALSRLPTEVRLVGSHGSEFDVGFRSELPPGLQTLRDTVRGQVVAVAEGVIGSYVEAKPAAIAFHYRSVAGDDIDAALDAVVSGPGSLDGVTVRHGSKVVELMLVDTNKGDALELIRHQVGATAVVFIGDDVTDEDAFENLTGPDLGIKVGAGDTAATYRVADTLEVSEVLAQICELRARWLAGSAAVPIERHSLLSDHRTVAIVTPDARVTWMCVPRIDSAAIFAELVGGPAAGYFSIRPANGGPAPTQAYADDSLRLVTSWPRLTVTDYLDCSAGRPERLAGRSDLLRVVEGTGTVTIEFAPRLDFGRSPTQLEARDDGLQIHGAADLLALRSPGIDWTIVDEGIHQTARAEVDVGPEPLVLEFRCGTANLRPEGQEESDRRASTDRFWTTWAATLDGCEVQSDLVRRSALTLKALCYGPTGAIVAAATTSLPENIGGVRNWDYRYCWLRDAALSAAALVRLGSHNEAMDYLDWVLAIIDNRDDGDRVQPLYNVTGRHLPPEAEIAELAGYAGSRPVRVGNAAERQIQLDVFGPIVDLVHLLLERNAPLSGRHWDLVQAMVAAVEHRWREPDHGIWEIRKPPRHHVYSKTMCWLTVDRAIDVADHFINREQPGWAALRDEIAADIFAHGYDRDTDTFTAAYDSTDVDASVLAVGLSGLVPPDDQRYLGTIRAVEETLRDGPTVYRYLDDDGLPGREGGFHLMTSWLIDSYSLVGRHDDARELFDALSRLAGPTGLFSEEYDPATGRALGNHPQAYSHLGFINNALGLSRSPILG